MKAPKLKMRRGRSARYAALDTAGRDIPFARDIKARICRDAPLFRERTEKPSEAVRFVSKSAVFPYRNMSTVHTNMGR